MGSERLLGAARGHPKPCGETGSTFWAVTLHSSPPSGKVIAMENKQLPMPQAGKPRFNRAGSKTKPVWMALGGGRGAGGVKLMSHERVTLGKGMADIPLRLISTPTTRSAWLGTTCPCTNTAGLTLAFIGEGGQGSGRRHEPGVPSQHEAPRSPVCGRLSPPDQPCCDF